MGLEDSKKYSSLLNQYPSFRDDSINGCWRWIEGRRQDDGAEGLWRVHDKLYDVSKFIDKHPGGRNWLELTQGTDVTEAFETHHIATKASEVLKKFYVRDAFQPRSYKISFDENGFYKTLKRRAVERLKTIDIEKHSRKSKQMLDINLLALIVTACLAMRSESFLATGFWCLLCGQFVGWSANFAHNFIHQRDNWRMYTANISMVSWRDFRVFHVMSHHMYTNTWSDLEVSNFEKHLLWMPAQIKTKVSVLYSIIISPASYSRIFLMALFQRYLGALFAKAKGCYYDEVLSFALPALMLFSSSSPFSFGLILGVYIRWMVIIHVGSFLYGLFAVNNGHHGPEILHEGDEIDTLDFGAFQIRAIVDREAADENDFAILAYFGQHTLHHLFPTLDHSVLRLLEDTYQKTCEEFSLVPHKKVTFREAAIEQFKQLGRTEIKKLQ